MRPFDIYLASQSPRRRQLLEQVCVRFERLPIEIDETPLEHEPPLDYVERVAGDKARAAVPIREHDLPVLAADTAVVCDSDIFGKPRDQQHAAQMLRRLSGRTHEVMTAVAIADSERFVSTTQISEVTFADLDEQTISAYWATGEPADKAGAYGCQGMAASFISSIKGSFYGVMGLPLFDTLGLLREFGVAVWPQGAEHGA